VDKKTCISRSCVGRLLFYSLFSVFRGPQKYIRLLGVLAMEKFEKRRYRLLTVQQEHFASRSWLHTQR